MRRIFDILGDSFNILGQNFVLTYPHLLFFMVMVLAVPKQNLTSLTFIGEMGLPLLMLIGGLTLLIFAIMAGLFQMLTKAVKIYFEAQEKEKAEQETRVNTTENRNPEEFEDIIFQPFLLLKELIPGIGEHFQQFVIGGGINILVLAAIAYFLFQNTSDITPALQNYYSVLQTAVENNTLDMEAILAQISKEHQKQLSAFIQQIGTGFFIYAAFFLVTIFWPALVVLKEQSALNAYINSIKLFFSDPLRILFIGLFYLIVNFVINLLFLSNPILMSLRAFVAIFIDLYFLIATVVYIYTLPQPEPLEGKEAVKTDAG